MCGIAGHFAYTGSAPPVSREALLQTRDRMTARGPDGAGVWFSDDRMLGLAHRRLAIIDLTDMGAQPMQSMDRRFTVTFNGEIYNYPQLRRELMSEGVSFNSQSDTEVLLHLFRRHGPSMVEKLRGMFAFAIWDAQGRSLFLARDPYGIKPLYYADDGNTLRFASQVNALKSGGGIDLAPDPGGAVGFLLWGSVPEPFTLYRAIRLLPAGHTLTIANGRVGAPRQYWSLAKAMEHSRKLADGIRVGEEQCFLREQLLDSVRAHLLADVPVGAFLSAGMDSSTLVGLARETTSTPLQTLTLTFDDFLDTKNDECPLAAEIARHLDVNHRCIVLPAGEQEDEIDRFFGAMDQPTIDGVNTWFISKAAVQAGLKVSISGLGGDELLGGYASFQQVPEIQEQARRSPWSHFSALYLYLHTRAGSLLKWSPNSAGIPRYGHTPHGAYHLAKGVFMPWELGSVMEHETVNEGLRQLAEEDAAQKEKLDSLNIFEQVAHLESVRYMRNQLLRDTDWVGMAHSLEIRVPLVDSKLTEAVIGLAATGRLGSGKSSLYGALKQKLPETVRNRPKTGFVTPTWRWLRHHPGLDVWRKIPFLVQSRVHDPRRWAYTILHRVPEARAFLKNAS